MAHGDVREEKWRGNKRMKWVTSKRHMTAEDRLARAVQKPCRLMCVTRLPVFDWTDVPGRFKWTRPFRRKTKSGFCACAITFQMQSTTSWPCSKGLLQDRCLQVCNKLVCTCYRHSVAVRPLKYRATCFDPHLGNFQVNVLHKINYVCMCLFYCIDYCLSP